MKRSTCPKCGYALRLTDWREECPQCGVNMTYYNKEAILLQDADRAEIEFALFQPHMDRAKASFIGSPYTIARLCCSLLPAGALFLPLCNLRYTALLENEHVTYTIIQLIEVLKYRQWDRIFGAMPGILPIALPLFGALLCLVLHAVGIIGGCTKKGKIFLFVADAAMLLLTGCSIGSLLRFTQNISAALPQYIDRFSAGIGVCLFPALLILCLLSDVVVAVRGIPVKYTQRYIAAVPAEEYFAAHPELCAKKG
jgi:hypothetical protein